MADIELSVGQWNDLIPHLLDMIKRAHSAVVKKSSLQCLGFICETIQSDVLSSQSNAILTAVAEGAKADEKSAEVRYAALQALINSLSFIRANFEREVSLRLISGGTELCHADCM